MSVAALHLLLLIVVANGVPVIMSKLMGPRMDYPLDMGRLFIDGKPILGATKTWRGVFFAVLLTALVSGATGYGLLLGAQVALLAMVGDMASSFTKRRMNMPSSSRALLLDQVPESLLPALVMMPTFTLEWLDVIVLVPAFIMLELLLSKFLYKLGFRKTPY